MDPNQPNYNQNMQYQQDPNMQYQQVNQQNDMNAQMQMQMQQMQMQMQQQSMQNNMQMMQMQQKLQEHDKLVEYKNLEAKMMDMEHGVYIKQKWEILEIVTALEMPNTYYAYKRSPGGSKKQDKQFKFKEKSECFQRYCCAPSVRALDIKCKNIQKVQDSEECMKLEKECAANCYCCCRANMSVKLTEKENVGHLGKVHWPYACCDYVFQIYNDKGVEDFKIVGNACQCYFWCGNCACKDCNKCVFILHSPEEGKCGELVKKGKECCARIGYQDNFTCDFPKSSNWKQRALLMCSIMFIDYCMFEEKDDGQSAGGIH